MRPRAWPGALLSGASLAAACLVVGDHVAATRQGCPDSAGWFSATPVVLPSDPTRSGAEGKPAPDKTGSGQAHPSTKWVRTAMTRLLASRSAVASTSTGLSFPLRRRFQTVAPDRPRPSEGRLVPIGSIGGVLHSVHGLVEVGDQIVDVLDTDAEPDQRGRNLQR